MLSVPGSVAHKTRSAACQENGEERCGGGCGRGATVLHAAAVQCDYCTPMYQDFRSPIDTMHTSAGEGAARQALCTSHSCNQWRAALVVGRAISRLDCNQAVTSA